MHGLTHETHRRNWTSMSPRSFPRGVWSLRGRSKSQRRYPIDFLNSLRLTCDILFN